MKLSKCVARSARHRRGPTIKRAALILLALSWASLADAAVPAGGISPDFALPRHADGQPVALHDFAGKIVLVEFFAWWCVPSNAASTSLGNGIGQFYAAGGNPDGLPVEIVSISVEPSEPAATDQFITAHGLGTVLDDFSRSAFELYDNTVLDFIPRIVLVNGVAGANRPQWQVLYNQAGFGGDDQVATLRTLIDSIDAAPFAPVLPPAVPTSPPSPQFPDPQSVVTFSLIGSDASGTSTAEAAIPADESGQLGDSSHRLVLHAPVEPTFHWHVEPLTSHDPSTGAAIPDGRWDWLLVWGVQAFTDGRIGVRTDVATTITIDDFTSIEGAFDVVMSESGGPGVATLTTYASEDENESSSFSIPAAFHDGRVVLGPFTFGALAGVAGPGLDLFGFTITFESRFAPFPAPAASGSPTPPPAPTPTRTPAATSSPPRTPAPTKPPATTPTPVALLTITDAAVKEGPPGVVTPLLFTVKLSAASKDEVTVNYKTVDGSAVAGSDYGAASGTLLFKPGVVSQTVSVAVSGDKLGEKDETFSLALSSAKGAKIVQATASGTIVNDDVGIAELIPLESFVDAGERVGLDLRWTHPVRWRELRTLELRLRAGSHVAFTILFDEAADSLRLCDGGATPRCTAASAPGSVHPLANAWATVDVAGSAVVASGPDDPSVELILFFRLARRAAGSSFVVETRAVDDDGNIQGFEPIGAVTVSQDAPAARRLIPIRRPTQPGVGVITR